MLYLETHTYLLPCQCGVLFRVLSHRQAEYECCMGHMFAAFTGGFAHLEASHLYKLLVIPNVEFAGVGGFTVRPVKFGYGSLSHTAYSRSLSEGAIDKHHHDTSEASTDGMYVYLYIV